LETLPASFAVWGGPPSPSPNSDSWACDCAAVEDGVGLHRRDRRAVERTDGVAQFAADFESRGKLGREEGDPRGMVGEDLVVFFASRDLSGDAVGELERTP